MAKSARHDNGAYSEAMKNQGTGLPSYGKKLEDSPPSAGGFKRDTPLDAGGSATPSGMGSK